MKLKYYTLTKEEKQKIKKEFYQTTFGKEINLRLNRVFIISILCFAYSIFLFIKYENIWELISAIALVLAGLIFLIGSFKVRIDKINHYLVTKKRDKK